MDMINFVGRDEETLTKMVFIYHLFFTTITKKGAVKKLKSS